MKTTNCGLVAGLEPVMVQAKQLGIWILASADRHEERDPVLLGSLGGASSNGMIDLQRSLVTETADRATSAEELDSFGSGHGIPTSAAVSGQLANTIRILFSPPADSFKSPEVDTAGAHSGLLGELVQGLGFKTDTTNTIFDIAHGLNGTSSGQRVEKVMED